MSIKVTLRDYMEWCAGTVYGSKFFDEPQFVQDALDELFDGQEFDEGSNSDPDNVYINSFYSITDKEMLDYYGDSLGYDSERDDPAEFIETHEQEIIDCISDEYYYLGHEKGDWYYLQ